MDNQSNFGKSKHSQVEKGCWTPIRIRFEALFNEHRKKRTELTNYMGWDKAMTSRIVNGREIPNIVTRIKISKFFGIDSSVIWENPELAEGKNEGL